MGEVVHRVDQVLAARPRVRLVLQSVHDRVSQGRIGVFRNALESQGLVVCQIGEYLQGLFDAPLPVRVGLFVLSLCLYFLLGAVADIGIPLLDESVCEVLQLFEVITGKGDLIGCVPQPSHVVFDLLDELVRLLVRICVVIA